MQDDHELVCQIIFSYTTTAQLWYNKKISKFLRENFVCAKNLLSDTLQRTRETTMQLTQFFKASCHKLKIHIDMHKIRRITADNQQIPAGGELLAVSLSL